MLGCRPYHQCLVHPPPVQQQVLTVDCTQQAGTTATHMQPTCFTYQTLTHRCRPPALLFGCTTASPKLTALLSSCTTAPPQTPNRGCQTPRHISTGPAAACSSSHRLTVVDEERVPQLHIQLRLAQWEALTVPAQQHVTQWPCLNRLVQNHLQSQNDQQVFKRETLQVGCAVLQRA